MRSLKNKWDRFSVKTKWTILIVSISIIYLSAYHFNIKKTREQITLYNTLSNEFKLITEHTKNNSSSIDVIDSTLNVENNLSVLNYISSVCEERDIYINEIAQTTNDENDIFTIETTKLVLTGKYENILNLIYHIEKERKIARVNSAFFYLTRYKTNPNHTLLATIYIKYIRNENTQ